MEGNIPGRQCGAYGDFEDVKINIVTPRVTKKAINLIVTLIAG